MKLLSSFLFVFIFLLTGCFSLSDQRKVNRFEVDYPNDFKAQQSDWVDMGRYKVGWPLGHRKLRGKTLKPSKGIYPIHIMKADLPEFEGTPFMVDDLILGVSGQRLGPEGVDQVTLEVKRSAKLNRPIDFVRWRQGVIETVSLNFRLSEKGNKVPDLLKGDEPDETRDWSLGPIGVNGWGFAYSTNKGGSDKTRQILITWVDPQGPGYGKLKLGDVIIGVNEKPFNRDARKVLAAGINEAEKIENNGKLSLLLWRPKGEKGEGSTMNVSVQIPVLGAYSPTAPFDCRKTDKIIDRAVDFMKENHEKLIQPNWIGYINALGLMSTGREDVMPLMKKLAQESLLKDGESLSVEKHVSMMCWRWSYRTLFLCEYYLLTKDASVLPTIEEYGTKISMGQSGAGTWGHTYAARENTGYLHGHLGGYGAINQMGLTLMVALPLVKKCGIENKEINDAIQRGDDFFSYFIGKGTIPYGDHGAAPWYDDNGKSGSAAVYFDLMNNREGTDFFSKMVLASATSGREQGHTGHFWSHLWGGIGALRGGEKLFTRFMQEMDPIFTLERQYNGRFAYQDNVGEKGTRGQPKTKWDSTGSRLLQLCAPRRVLLITGKETPKPTEITSKRMEEILEAGRLKVLEDAREKLELPQILELLQDPLPPTRAIAVSTLEEREIDCVDDLLKMLESDNRFARYGAAEALGRVGFNRKDVAEKLIELMEKDKDTLFRIYALRSMTNTNLRLGLFNHARPAIPVLLRMAKNKAKDDPRRVLQYEISRALFWNERAGANRGLIARYGLEGVDRKLLIPAVREILKNENGFARSIMTAYLYPKLTKVELDQLWGDIFLATRYIAPSGIMFASDTRTHGLELMAKHGVEEGMFLSAWYLRWQKGHGSEKRYPPALNALRAYGEHAKPFIPYLEEHAVYFEAKRNPRRKVSPTDKANRLRSIIEDIRASKEKPDLISIGKHVKQRDMPHKNGP